MPSPPLSPQQLTLYPLPLLLCPQVSAAEISAICQEAGMHAVRKNRCEYVGGEGKVDVSRGGARACFAQ